MLSIASLYLPVFKVLDEWVCIMLLSCRNAAVQPAAAFDPRV